MTAFRQDDYFKIDPEAHLVGDMAPLMHFPGVQMWWRAIEGCKRAFMTGIPPKYLASLEPHDLESDPDSEALLGAMDRYGVDVACLLPESMMDTTGYSSRWCSNGDMARAVERHPDRFMYQPNVSPVKHRGVKAAVWELEYWVKERNAKIFKLYPPEDTFINDPSCGPSTRRRRSSGSSSTSTPGSAGSPPERASTHSRSCSTTWRGTSQGSRSWPSTWATRSATSSTWWRWATRTSTSA